MGEKRMALEGFDDGHDPVMAADSQVVALGNVMGKDYPRALTDSRENGE
jgi:hypothetical protein